MGWGHCVKYHFAVRYGTFMNFCTEEIVHLVLSRATSRTCAAVYETRFLRVLASRTVTHWRYTAYSVRVLCAMMMGRKVFLGRKAFSDGI